MPVIMPTLTSWPLPPSKGVHSTAPTQSTSLLSQMPDHHPPQGGVPAQNSPAPKARRARVDADPAFTQNGGLDARDVQASHAFGPEHALFSEPFPSDLHPKARRARDDAGPYAGVEAWTRATSRPPARPSAGRLRGRIYTDSSGQVGVFQRRSGQRRAGQIGTRQAGSCQIGVRQNRPGKRRAR